MNLFKRVVIACALLLAPGLARAIDVSTCGAIGSGSTPQTFTLINNLTAPAGTGDCITLNGTNKTLDLAGFTITYDNDAAGIANAGFELGTGGVPDDWDLSLANGHAIRTTTADYAVNGQWYLDMQQAVAGDAVQSPFVTLPANRQCGLTFLTSFAADAWLGCGEPAIQVTVEDVGLTVVAGFPRTIDFRPPGGSCPGDGLLQYVPFTTTAATSYRLRILVTRAGVSPSPNVNSRFGFDMVDLRTVGDFGIRVTAGGTTYGINEIRGPGTIQQGVGGGNTFPVSPPFMTGGGILVASGTRVHNLTINTVGMVHSAITGQSVSKVRVDSVTAVASGASCFRRGDLNSVINLTGSSNDNKVLKNTITTGGGMGGVRVEGNCTPGTFCQQGNGRHEVSLNTINAQSNLTNLAGIITYHAHDGLYVGNTINATNGQGMLLSSGSSGTEVASNNITLNGIKPGTEYGLISFDALRVNDYNPTDHRTHNLYVHHNTIILNGGLDAFHNVVPYNSNCNTPGNENNLTCTGKVMNGIMNFTFGSNNRYENNTITVQKSDPTVIGSCVEVGDTPNGTTPFTTWTNNTFVSNNKVLVTGGYAQRAFNSIWRGNTFQFSVSPDGIQHMLFTRRTIAGINNVDFIGSTFIGGASFAIANTRIDAFPYCESNCLPCPPTDQNCVNPGPCYRCSGYDFTVKYVLTVQVLSSQGQEFNNVNVTITDAMLNVVGTGTTSGNGTVSFDLTHFRRTGANHNTSTANDVLHTPHSITTDVTDTPTAVTMDANKTVVIQQGTPCCPAKGCCEQFDEPPQTAP